MIRALGDVLRVAVIPSIINLNAVHSLASCSTTGACPQKVPSKHNYIANGRKVVSILGGKVGGGSRAVSVMTAVVTGATTLLRSCWLNDMCTSPYPLLPQMLAHE